MPRNPLYRASLLTLDYHEEKGYYCLKRDNNEVGSMYDKKGARSLVASIEKSVREDRRFFGIHLVVTDSARESLEEMTKREE